MMVMSLAADLFDLVATVKLRILNHQDMIKPWCFFGFLVGVDSQKSTAKFEGIQFFMVSMANI